MGFPDCREDPWPLPIGILSDRLAEQSYAPAEGLDFVPDRYRMLQWLSTAHVQRDDCRSALPFARRAQAVEDAVLPEFWRARSSSLFPAAVLC